MAVTLVNPLVGLPVQSTGTLWTGMRCLSVPTGSDGLLQHAEHPAAGEGPGLCLRLAGDRLAQGLHRPDTQPHSPTER